MDVTCRYCSTLGSGIYCSSCGQAFAVKRITLHSLFHDVAHFFTHIDKGLPFTFKKLLTSPGVMQRDYILGNRKPYQQPFSMFFICVTFAALARFWIMKTLVDYYHYGQMAEGNFFHEYLALIQISMFPAYVLITKAFFYKSEYNLAETGVFLLYTLSMFLIISTALWLIRFIWHDIDMVYLELPAFLIYNTLASINFYRNYPKWKAGLLSILALCTIIALNQIVEQMLYEILNP